MHIFSRNLSHLAEAMGWSQAELGKALGISQGMASKYLKGKASPSLKMLDKCAEVFGVSIEELFRKGEVPKPRVDQSFSLLRKVLGLLHTADEFELREVISTIEGCRKGAARAARVGNLASESGQKGNKTG